MRLPYLVVLGTAATLVAGAIVKPALAFEIPGLLAVAFSATGLVIALREQRNAIGWLFLTSGFGAALAILSHAIPDRLIEHGHAGATITGVLGAYGSASWVPFMLPPLTLTLLLFPHGRLLPGRRWKVVAWCAVGGMAIAFLGTFLQAGRIEDYKALENPIGVKALAGLDGPGFMLMFVALIGGPVALWRRFRGADPVTRQQIRWLALAGAVAAALFIIGFIGFAVFPTGSESGTYAVMMLGVLALPLAVATSILRYRLYDIDVVINRALVYTGLTVTLVGAYLLTVLLAQLVLPARSDLGVAMSTLAAAAVFTPARRRIQAVVDRRFFRRRFDAQRTLEAFGTRVRDEVDLDALSQELSATVADTMQPAHVSLWLRT